MSVTQVRGGLKHQSPKEGNTTMQQSSGEGKIKSQRSSHNKVCHMLDNKQKDEPILCNNLSLIVHNKRSMISGMLNLFELNQIVIKTETCPTNLGIT